MRKLSLEEIRNLLSKLFAEALGRRLSRNAYQAHRKELKISEALWSEMAQKLNENQFLKKRNLALSARAIRETNSINDLAELLFEMQDRGLPRPHVGASPDDGISRSVRSIPNTGLKVKQEEEGREYPVWFATNRRPARSNQGFSSQRDDVTHFGRCRVFIPKCHKIGSLGSGFFRRLISGEDDRLRLMSTCRLSEANFWMELSAGLSGLSAEDRHAVIFVHGYNVSFQEAALRAAQIGCDLAIEGGVAFFSWPSLGRITSYLADSASIEASEVALADFLVRFAQESSASKIHVIAHSMGNRGLLRAVERVVRHARGGSNKFIDQIILAAPDVDVGTFRHLCAAYGFLANRTTLYVSRRDLAVRTAKQLHRFDRVGYAPPVCVVPGIDTVNVTQVDMSVLGHGYVAEARPVLVDMYDLLRRGVAPDQRFGLAAMVSTAGRYWEFCR